MHVQQNIKKIERNVSVFRRGLIYGNISAIYLVGLVVQPALGYHITNRQSRYITPARLKSAYTTQQVVASS